MSTDETAARLESALLEAEELRARVGTLEHLLEVHERVALAQTQKLEQAMSEAVQRSEALEESEGAKAELVDRLRLAVDELSTPILHIWEGVLALPIIGVIDSIRAAQLSERLLDQVARQKVAYVVIDVTGVQVIDTATAQHFISLVRSVELLGSQCLLTGIQPAVALTLMHHGVELGSIRTLRNLSHALRAALDELASRE